MNNRRPLQVVRRRWASIVVVTALALLGGLGYVLTAPVTYEASASSFFALTIGNSAADLVQGSTYTQNQVESFAELATTPAVLQPVIDQLGLATTPADLAGEVQAVVPVGTVIVRVTVTDPSAQGSAQKANAIVASLAQVVAGVAPKDSAGASTVVASTVAPAEVPSSPASPNQPLVFAGALVLGLLLGGCLVWAREALDTRVRDAAALALLTDRPLIGTISNWTARGAQRVVVSAAPHSASAEAFRQLRTNLQFLRVADEQATGSQVVAVTSSTPAEGKSTVSSNLAAALAETGARVLLVDADLRRPAIADVLGLEGGAGLTTVLAGQAAFDDVVQEWGGHGLSVLTSGPVPPNPTELLGSPAMRRLVGQLRTEFDYVVVDTAPLLPVADTAVLSRLVDGTVVVAQAGRVRRGEVVQALANLDQVTARVLGVVLNRVRRDEEAYTYRPARAEGDAATGVQDAPATAGRGSRVVVG